MKKLALATLSLVLLLTLTPAEEGGQPSSPRLQIAPQRLVALYHCMKCHGTGAAPDFKTIAKMEMKRSGDILFASSNIADVILNGSGNGGMGPLSPGKMPAYESRGITPEQAASIAQYILDIGGFAGVKSRFNSDIGGWPLPDNKRKIIRNHFDVSKYLY